MELQISGQIQTKHMANALKFLMLFLIYISIIIESSLKNAAEIKEEVAKGKESE